MFSDKWSINLSAPVVKLTLNLQVEDDLVWTKAIAGHTSVIPRILRFHCANNKAAISMDTPPAVYHNRSRGSIAGTQTDIHI